MVIISSFGMIASADSVDSKTPDDSRKLPEPLQLSDEQREAIRDARTGSVKNAVEALVSEEVLTQDEADAILAELNKEHTKSKPEAPATDNDASNYAPREFEKNKSRDKNSEYIKEKGFLNLTAEQIKSLTEKINQFYQKSLEELVSDGTITQEIADKIQNMPMGIGRGKGFGPAGIGKDHMNCKKLYETDLEESNSEVN